MGTPGPVALILVALAVLLAAGVLVTRGRRRAAVPAGPRTVAELVRLQAERAAGSGAEVPAVLLDAQPDALPDADPGAEPGTASGADRAPAEAVRPETEQTGAPEQDAPPASGPSTRPSAAAATGVSAPPGESTADGAVETADEQTPWGRAALMAVAGPAEPVIPVPRPVPPRATNGAPGRPNPPVWTGSGGATDGGWSGWADWNEVDAEVDADLAARRATGGRGPDRPGLRAVPSAIEERVPQEGRRVWPYDTGAAKPPAAVAEPAAPEPAQPEPEAPVPVPSHSGAGTVAPTSATPRPQGRPPVPPTLDEPDPDMPRRPLRTPAQQAAEQAAADLALLRTFGFADPHLRPESAPVVSLASSQDAAAEPEPDGAAQPVRFAVATPDGAPVGRAALTLLDDRGRDVAKGSAGADGRGELQAPRPGAFMLIASSVGFQAVAVAVTVAEAPADVAVTLTRSASVHGTVLGEDGPIAGARVTLVQDHEIVDAVDSGRDGGYRIEDVPAGEYGLSVAAAGCEPFAALLVVPDASELRRDVELQSASPQVEADSGSSGQQDGGGYQDVAEVLRSGGQADPPGR